MTRWRWGGKGTERRIYLFREKGVWQDVHFYHLYVFSTKVCLVSIGNSLLFPKTCVVFTTKRLSSLYFLHALKTHSPRPLDANCKPKCTFPLLRCGLIPTKLHYKLNCNTVTSTFKVWALRWKNSGHVHTDLHSSNYIFVSSILLMLIKIAGIVKSKRMFWTSFDSIHDDLDSFTLQCTASSSSQWLQITQMPRLLM